MLRESRNREKPKMFDYKSNMNKKHHFKRQTHGRMRSDEQYLYNNGNQDQAGTKQTGQGITGRVIFSTPVPGSGSFQLSGLAGMG